MELPRPLIPWADYLDIFPRDLALALGPLVQRLDLVIGTLSTSRRASTGEPDGFDGISQRGTYDRLLLSEWLLAEEVPEEFSRRAAMNEHAFLQRAHREPAGTKTSVVLFDGGPNQWGTPRIAHVAALIVLARRTQSSGARFLWGTLQTPTGPLFTDVTTNSVSELLAARSVRDPTDADLVSWRERLLAETEDDFWVIGGKPIADFSNLSGASFLRIDDVLEPDVRRLSIEIPSGIRRREPILLELPEDTLCARLLRDPFPKATSTVAAKPAKISIHGAPASNLLFPVGGSKVLARSQRKGVLSYSIPNSPNAPSGKPKRFQSVYGNTILAAGRVAKSTVVVSVMDTQPAFRLEALGARSPSVVEGVYPWNDNGADCRPPGIDTPLQTCFEFPAPSLRGSSPAKIVMRTPCGNLFCLESESGERRARLLASGIEALTPLHESRMVYVLRQLGKRYLVKRNEHDEESKVAIAPSGEGVFFGYGGTFTDSPFGFLAVEGENRHWHIYTSFRSHLGAEQEEPLVAPRGMTVVGATVAGFIDTGERPVLVLLSEDRRTITLLGRTGSRVLPRTDSPIAHVTVSTFALQIAYTTERGDVLIYSILLEAVIYRLITETMK